jgi:hypothetical protein
MTMWNDPIIEETRKLRDEYARQFKRFFAPDKVQQAEHGH